MVAIRIPVAVSNRFGETLSRANVKGMLIGERNAKESQTSTQPDGKGLLVLESGNGFPGPREVAFLVSWTDDQGVVWGFDTKSRLQLSVTPDRHSLQAEPRSFGITMRMVPQGLPAPEVGTSTRTALIGSPATRYIHDTYEEARDAFISGLPNASATLAGKTMETAILIRGISRGWPVGDWQERRFTLGNYIGEKVVSTDIIEVFGDGFYDLLRGSNVARIMGAHQKFETIHMDDSRAVLRAVTRLLDGWFGNPPTKPPV